MISPAQRRAAAASSRPGNHLVDEAERLAFRGRPRDGPVRTMPIARLQADRPLAGR